MVAKNERFDEVGCSILFGDGLGGPLQIMGKHVHHLGPMRVVLEESEEYFSFPESPPISHKGFCLHF